MHFSPRMLTVLLCVVSVSLLPFASAQSTSASLSGQVTDVQGLVVVGAEVDAVNQATNVVYSTKTNGEGIYSLPDLPPGTYEVHILKDGFRTLIRPGIELHVQDARALNATLQVGDKAEIVRVEGGAALVNTESASVGTVIDREFVQNIALNGQSFNTLLQLTPGVTIVTSSSESSGQFSINGQRSNANYFQVDGVGANFGASNQQAVGEGGGGGTQAFNAYGGTASLVSVDALQEFRVETSSFAPEYGRTPGGQVSITTRSGTNQFHGDVFDYLRNTVLDANNWFANAAGKPRAPEHQNDFGGVFGGPIVKDKTFFFLSYEGLRLRQPQTTVIQVPSTSLRQSAIPAAASVLNAYPQPDPNGPISPDGTMAQFTGNYSSPIGLNAGSVRIDQSINSRWNIFGRFNYAPSQLTTRVDSLSTVQDQPTDTTTFTLGVDGQLMPYITNGLRFNYSIQTAKQLWQLDNFNGAVPVSSGSFIPSQFSSSDGYGIFAILNTGIPSLQVGTGTRNTVSQWTLVDNIAMLRSRHSLKFGVAYNRLLSETGPQAFGGQYSVPDVQHLQQFASTAQVPEFQNSVVRGSKIIFNELSLYAQDRWSLGDRLTLTYGLRWEFNPPPTGENTVLASWQNTSDLANLALAPVGTPIWKTTYGNFAPRLGFAYRVTKNGDLVVRAGTGIFYDLGTGIAPILGTQLPNTGLFTDNSGTNSYPVPIANVQAVTPSFSLTPPYTGPVAGFSDNLKLPYSFQWNAAIEKSFGEKQAVSITYLGQVGRRLLRQVIDLQPNANFAQNEFSLTDNADNSNYNAMQIQFKRAMSHGLQALLNYTWSHSIDTNSSDTNTPAFVAPIAAERGSSDFDVRHNLTTAFTYSAPTLRQNAMLRKVSEGWALSGFALVRSGSPIGIRTFSLDPTCFSCGVLTVRPDLVLGQPIWTSDSTAAGGRVVNPNAFALHLFAPRQGTLPRNTIYGFGATQFDTSIQRNFAFTESMRLQFRADAFNVFNHPNFAFAGLDVLFFGPGNPQFGRSSHMLNQGLSNGAGLNPLYSIGGPRSMQLSLKLFF